MPLVLLLPLLADWSETAAGFQYDLRGTSSFVESEAGGGSASGTNVYVQSPVLSLKTVTAADNVELQALATNRPHALIIDYKGGLWLAGHEFGLEVLSIEAQRGSNPEDFVGYTVTFEGKEKAFAAYAGQLDAAGAPPSTLNISVTKGATDIG